MKVHLEAEHFTKVFFGRCRQADALGQYLVIWQQQYCLLDFARDIGVFDLRRIERQPQNFALGDMIAEAKKQLVAVDLHIQFLLTLFDRFLEVVRQ